MSKCQSENHRESNLIETVDMTDGSPHSQQVVHHAVRALMYGGSGLIVAFGSKWQLADPQHFDFLLACYLTVGPLLLLTAFYYLVQTGNSMLLCLIALAKRYAGHHARRHIAEKAMSCSQTGDKGGKAKLV